MSMDKCAVKEHILDFVRGLIYLSFLKYPRSDLSDFLSSTLPAGQRATCPHSFCRSLLWRSCIQDGPEFSSKQLVMNAMQFLCLILQDFWSISSWRISDVISPFGPIVPVVLLSLSRCHHMLQGPSERGSPPSGRQLLGLSLHSFSKLLPSADFLVSSALQSSILLTITSLTVLLPFGPGIFTWIC